MFKETIEAILCLLCGAAAMYLLMLIGVGYGL